MNPKDIVKAKVRRIQDGYSAFAESNELVRLMKKEISRSNVDVFVDETNIGSWFIPKKHV
ncbi:MAG TPA: hypothetical protein VFK27_04320 [Bacillales bacterium]|jgi:hypothetical protein|nr:hypothetical protein [Bacillales bacterium]